jgi:hypothetical protein
VLFEKNYKVTCLTSYGGVKVTVFWYVTPYSLVYTYRHFRRTCCFRRHGRKWSSSYQTIRRHFIQNIVTLKAIKFDFTSTMKMEAADSSETRVTTHQTVWCPNTYSLTYLLHAAESFLRS